MWVILRALPVRGESHIQRNANREVAIIDVNRATTAFRAVRFWKILPRSLPAALSDF